MEISSDFKELLQTFNDAAVKYLIVGAHAVGYHGHPRGTGDLDIWVDRSPENAARVFRALATFGAPLNKVTEGDFTGDDLIFQIGIEPIRIDVMTSISGVDFDQAWARRIEDRIEGVHVAFIAKNDLIQNKRATGRHRDLADLEELSKTGQ